MNTNMKRKALYAFYAVFLRREDAAVKIITAILIALLAMMWRCLNGLA